MIFKVVPAHLWSDACKTGAFHGSADDLRDGYIHFSSATQLRGTLEKHFSAERDLILIAYEESSLDDMLKWEPSRGGQLFPHVYGVLNPAAAVWCKPIDSGADGAPEFNPRWLTC